MTDKPKSLFSAIGRRFAACFLQGLIAILPLVITVAVVVWVVGFLQSYLGPATFLGKYLSAIGLNLGQGAATPYIAGWIAVLGIVFGVGVLVELGAKKLLRKWSDVLFHKIPLVGRIYTTSRQMIDMLDQQDENAMQGMSAVYCFWGEDRNTAALAFLASPKRFDLLGREYHVVILPTAPIPFGGAMLFVPVENVVKADMSIDGLMSVYLSMGVAASEFIKVVPNSSGTETSEKTVDRDIDSEGAD